MKTNEKPILFSGEMVRAIIAGNKKQTRREIKPQPKQVPLGWIYKGRLDGPQTFLAMRCPYGIPGDRLWCKETFANHPEFPGYIYRADRGGDYQGAAQGDFKWKPSIFMPRAASRLTLEIVSVRVERLQDISHKDALAEGVEYDLSKPDGSPLDRYKKLWETINGKGSWATNPFVWRIEFRKL